MALLGVPRLLYGALHVTIEEGRHCIRENPLSKNLGGIFKGVMEGVERVSGIYKDQSDCYVIVSLHTARVCRTAVVNGSVSAKWDEEFIIYCAHNVTSVVLTVKDKENVGALTLGKVCIPVEEVLSGKQIAGWYEVKDDAGKSVHNASIKFSMKFFEAEIDPAFGRGVGDGIRYPQDLQHVYFSSKRGCNVHLYQDAHVEDGRLPQIELEGGQIYKPRKYFEEVCFALQSAKQFIYIAGWSVYDKVTLVRDPYRQNDSMTLGELLKRKADVEGVKVLLLIWDDRTSIHDVFMKDGLMATRDEDTRKFFEGSRVQCVLCPRDPDESLSWFQGVQIGGMFTHHQKTVVLDSEIPGDFYQRRLTAFVGGIDLCNGRYDHQGHHLFQTLNTSHSNDFLQSSIEGADYKKGGPREPWHDIHSKVEGPAAWDILDNFEQRWKKQAGGRREHILPYVSQRGEMEPATAVIDEFHADESWNVQILRSIDTGSISGFPTSHQEQYEKGLVSGKGNIVDRSAQDGYIQAIRRAKNFIYIENQYFLGGCHMWEGDQNVGCFQLIPVEIALKICKKIEAGERFVAYIAIPLYPDGIVTAASTQEILHWEASTKAMMYGLIADALRKHGRHHEHPKDYLSFFCLGQREVERPGEYKPSGSPPEGSQYARAQINRRFMIYIHSKLMIVDDEFVIIGSANINQRSMDGSRDTEICMAAYQPRHTIATSRHGRPRGQIHGFRMSLWAEHTGTLEKVFWEPESLNCVRRLNMMGDHNWATFSGFEIRDLQGHLMAYPIRVGRDGIVDPLPGQENFPDTDSPIFGKKQDAMPNILTT